MSTYTRCIAIVGSLWDLLWNRDHATGTNRLGTQELSVAIDDDGTPGIYIEHERIAGTAKDHGAVANEAAMLGLHSAGADALETLYPRYVSPGDSCARADDPGWRWYCLSGNGTVLSDWERRPLAGALNGLATSGHTHTIAQVEGLSTALASQQSAIDGQQEEIDALADRQLSDSGDGVSLIASTPLGLRKLVAGAGVTIALVGGAIEISAEVSGAGAGATPGDAMTDFASLAAGEIVIDDSGVGWAAAATPYVADYPSAEDDFAGITLGDLTSYSGGTGWVNPVTAYTP